MVIIWLMIFVASAVLILYGQVGYALVCLAARVFFRGAKVEPSGTLPSVTLIVPAHNEERVLHSKLANSLRLDYPRELLEIIVASDGSTDKTVEIAHSFQDQGVRVLDFKQQRGKTSIVNDAVAAAQGDVLCLCDANVIFHPDALRLLVARLQDGRVGAASGDVRLASEESNFGEGERLYYRIERAIQVGESLLGSMMGVDGGMYVIRRHLFQSLPPSTILDDFATTLNVINQGQRVVYEPAAIADENGTPGARQEFRRRVRLAAGAAQLLKWRRWPSLRRPIELWQFLSHKLLRWVEPLLLATLLVSNIALWNQGWFFRGALAAQVFAYAAAIVAWPSLGFRGTRLGGAAFYFLMSHVAMALGLAKGLFNLQSVTWGRTERKGPSPELDPSAGYAGER
jgi:cellulose synthase/poly-beta-1,6-N-acetylglucosamine synthase-like glycosyltransferase